MSIRWQAGLGRGALATGLLVLPFSLGSMVTASASGWFANRFGRATIQAGIAASGPA